MVSKKDLLTNFKSFDFQCENPEKEDFKNWISKLETIYMDKKLIFICDHVETSWGLFKDEYTIVEAAGGIVTNDKNEILFIYRNEKWDLPKGKLEKNELIEECAIREVEEECGISNVKLTDFLMNTYHTYIWEGKSVIKPTHWYTMSYAGNEELIPQLEEGITEVKWIKVSELTPVYNNTYQNIIDVLENYFIF